MKDVPGILCGSAFIPVTYRDWWGRTLALMALLLVVVAIAFSFRTAKVRDTEQRADNGIRAQRALHTDIR